ncbi:sulfatase [bacterium]|nr:sulfatase [bacterium]
MNDQNAIKKPNILMIYPDELRADAIGCNGNSVIKTPYFDRLAEEGVRFEKAFTSFPLCTPFRSSLFTGKYAHATGCGANHVRINFDQEFLPQMLKDSGYQTGYIGKWHLDGGSKPGFIPSDRRLGFDHFVGFNRGHYYMNAIYFKDTDQPYHCPRYEPDFQTDHIIEFMDNALKKDPQQPFFGFICYGAPHFPMNMPDYYKNLYSPEEIPLPPGTADPELQQKVIADLTRDNFPLASGSWGEGTEHHGSLESEQAVREYMAMYYGMVANVDHNIGRILNWLDRKGIADDTMVIVVSDHGDMAGQHGYYCRTKKTAYAAAAQVPLLIRYPKRFPKNRTISSLVDASVDTMPTILEALGIDIPNAVHGISYLPLLEGSSDVTRTELRYEIIKQTAGEERFPVPERGIRTNEYLYVRTEKRRKLLINLIEDPFELNNLVDREEYFELMAEFDNNIDDHMRKTGDRWDIEIVVPPSDYTTHEEGVRLLADLHARAIVEL